MILKTDLINKIKNHFNLNIYETKVWLALLGKGIASAGEIAEISGVPRSRTYDVLESLEKRGFAMQKIGKPVKYFAVKPTSVIEKLKKNTLEDMNEKVQMLSTIKETPEYQELELLHTTTTELIKKQDISGNIKGKTNINAQISELIMSGKKEVIICSPVNEVKQRFKFLEGLFKQITDSKIKLTLALNGTDEEVKDISTRLGIKAKKVDIDASFYLVDKKDVLFMLNKTDDNNEQTAAWFSSPFLAKSFTSLFDIAMRGK